jgi:hypothetical protein
MVGRIRTDLNRGTDHDDRIKLAIEDAIKHYRARRLGFNMKRATSTTTADQEYYGLPTDFLEVDSLRLLETSNYYERLTEVTFAWIDDTANYQDFTSTPEKFAVQNRELRLYPKPDDTYTLQMSYMYGLGGVSAGAADSATNTWMTEGEELIRQHALADVLENYIGGQESILQAQVHQRRAERAFRELKRRAEREQTTGRIATWS